MKKLLTGFLLCQGILLFSQSEAITSAGSSARTKSYIVNWSLGSIVGGPSRSSNYIVNEGAPVDVYFVTYPKSNELTINCYPNPTTGSSMHLHVHTTEYEDMSWQIYSLNGVRMSSGSIDNDVIKININHLNAAIYLINVLDKNNHIIATGKISKQ